MISRQDAPPWVKRAGRAVSRAGGRLTASTRLLPSFLIVGTQRGGTTSLFRALAGHPDTAPANFHKGVHYFDVNYHRGPAWYRGHFPVRRPGNPVAAFESAGYYMHHPTAPHRIARDLPGVKLVALLREPVERAYSAYKHERARGFETEPLERALELEPERLAGEVERIERDPCYVSHSHRHHSYLDRGQYVEQLTVLFDLFGRDRVLVLFAEDFFSDPEPSFDRVLGFLGLRHWRPASFDRHNGRIGSDLPDRLRRTMAEHFVPYDDRLTDLLGELPPWRR